MTRVEKLCAVHGQQGGTIHQFNRKFRVNLLDLSEERFEYLLKFMTKHRDFYVGPLGELRWSSNDHVVPSDVFKDMGMTCSESHQKIYDDEQAKFIAEYRAAQKNYVPSAEELFEMRAAFGEGAEVVNVITGKKIKV